MRMTMDTTEVVEMNLPYVDASGYGDAYQVVFSKEPDPGADYRYDPDDTSPYFLIQRHFEPLDDGKCYVETEVVEMCGHYRATKASLGPECFYVELRGTKQSGLRFRIRFKADRETHKELVRVLSTMIGKERLHVEKSRA
jgi:hypothetical protein